MDQRKTRTIIETDVCVIGGSSSGMAAAINAADHGAKVVIVEKTGRLGGTLGMCGGFFAVESPAQKRLGIHDTAEECFKELIQILYWNCDAKLVRNWIFDSSETVRWLESLGITFDVVKPFQGLEKYCKATYHTLSVPPGTGRPGLHIMKRLIQVVEEKSIETYLKKKVCHLLKDDKGKICGVEAEGNGEILEIHAKAVIIATGSISNNPEMIKEYTGRDYEGVQIMAKVSHNTGDGVLLAKEAGAKRAEISALYIGPHNHGKGCSELTGMLIRRPYGIKINRAGDRFIDEGLWTNTDFGWMESYSIDRQPGQVCWAVFSEDLLNEMVEKNEEIGLFEHLAATLDCINKKKKNTDHSLIDSRFDFYDDSEFKGYWMEGLWEEIEKEIQNGRCRKCMNAKEIAEFTGCRYPERIQRTLERYNLFSRNGYDADFQKASEHLGELHPPYYVFLGKSGVDTFIGGVPINYELNVVDEDLYPIEGLYGAGVCTSGWLNNGYAFYGSELSFSFYSGRNAGIQAANYALRKC